MTSEIQNTKTIVHKWGSVGTGNQRRTTCKQNGDSGQQACQNGVSEKKLASLSPHLWRLHVSYT